MCPPTPKSKNLTSHQIEMIQKNWDLLNENQLASGQAIFYTFLTRHPEHQKRYQAFRDIPLEELKDTPQILRHCGKIMKFFDSVISVLGIEDSKETLIKNITENVQFHGKRGITKEHYNQIRAVIIEVVSGACNLDDEGKAAWNDLMDLMYHVSFNTLDGMSK